MIPLIAYAGVIPQPGLLLGYETFRQECAEWLGYGLDSTYWELTNPGATLELHNIVNEAYRWVLYPATIPGDPVNHNWTFLIQEADLTFVPDQYEYSTPANFASFDGEEIFWSSTGQGSGTIRRIDIHEFRRRRQFYQSSISYPQCFAVASSAPTLGEPQTQKLLFHPPPSSTYSVTYPYVINAEPLSETNPYPLGGQRISQLMLEGVRAYAELKKNKRRGDQWNVFKEALDSAIRMDRRTNTATTVGQMRGMRGRLMDLTTGSSSYYAPDTTGSYVLVEDV